MSSSKIRITVWHENVHDRTDEAVRRTYPSGMHGAVAAAIAEHLGDSADVRTATLDQPGQGLPDAVLRETDVMTWWGHVAHDRVSDDAIQRVHRRVLGGMGLVVLHSAHYSKIFKRLMGTTCSLRWREADDREMVWTVNPGHPIADGVPEVVVIPRQEMYGEYFDIPQPDELVFVSSFTGGEVFRSGCCFKRGRGRIFYFSPGHESFPVYHDPAVRRIIANAVRWAAPSGPILDRPYEAANAPTGWFERST